MNVKDRCYNQLCWEVDRKKPDWRMRSPIVERWHNKTRRVRGPQGPGGTVEAEGSKYSAEAQVSTKVELRTGSGTSCRPVDGD